MEYGIIGSVGCGISVLRPLILMQSRIIKVYLARLAKYPTNLIFKEFNVLNFDQACDMCLINCVHVKLGEFPETPGHVHGTRKQFGRRLREPRYNTSAAARHSTSRDPRLYNRTPASITGLFKRGLREYGEV